MASKAPRNLRAKTARVLILDEVDAMESGAEGSPINLAQMRTLSFADRKIILGSTPVAEKTSHVCRAYEKSDKRVFEIPCPECGEFWELMWEHIRWDDGDPETAHAVCPSCGSVIPERHKAAMVAGGRWRATAAEVEGHAGFRINSLVSTLKNASWSKLAAEFLQAKKSPDTLQVFVNTVLGQAWRDAAEEIDETALAARAEPFSLTALPPECLVITAGTDVQKDRIEVIFMGFGRENEIFVLGQSTIWGDPHDSTTWAELEDALKTIWVHPKGGIIRLDACAIDAGDGQIMQKVLDFTGPRFGRRVVAIKGAAGNRPIIQRSSSRSKLFIVGVESVKRLFTQRIAQIRFSDSLPATFWEEFTSERCVTRYKKGVPSRIWERIPGRRAEALDAAVYAYAARQLVKIDLDRREAELASKVLPPSRPTTIRSAWLIGRQ